MTRAQLARLAARIEKLADMTTQRFDIGIGEMLTGAEITALLRRVDGGTDILSWLKARDGANSQEAER
jgi:hypothetical protein